jgi:membrane protease YdiL (CAAX protease family)
VTTPASLRRPDWTGIALFYLIACGISMPLLAWRDLAPASWAASPIPPWLRPLLYGWGPAIGALIVLRVRARHHVRTITLTGGAPAASLAAVLGPICLLAVVAPARDAAAPHLAGLLAGIHAVAYAFGEELGWRGYLQDALRPLAPLPRYICIGLMWGVWHLLTFAGHGSPGAMLLRLLVFYAILIGASAGIGAAVDRSRSLLVATACHLFVTFSEVSAGRDRLVLLGVLVPAIVLLVRFWPRPPLAEATP